MNAPAPAPVVVSAEQRYLFDLQGCLLLKGVLDAEECARLAAALDEIDAAGVDDSEWLPRNRTGRASQPTIERQATSVRVNSLLRLSPRFHALIDHPIVTPYLETFMGGATPQLANAWSISKREGTDAGGWHRGLSPANYTTFGGTIVSRMLNVVFFLTDNGPDDGSMVAIPGSHKAIHESDCQKYPDPRDVPGVKLVTGKAGDVFMFSEAVMHNGTRKTTGGRRTNLYYNYITPDFNVMSYSPEHNHHFCYGPAVRDQFTQRQRAMTQWMEYAACEDDRHPDGAAPAQTRLSAASR